MGDNFADRLIHAVQAKGSPCIVGLDPRLDLMPDFVTRPLRTDGRADAVTRAITAFHEAVIETCAGLVPGVKLQLAFYEQYGVAGMQAFSNTVALARAAGLVVLADGKRNDIDSTAFAYANAFLGGAEVFGRPVLDFDIDALTVSPYLGRDSLLPFVDRCRDNGKGIFVLVKTSNPGSADLQDLVVGERTLSTTVAQMVAEMGDDLRGDSGYSPIGAVVGATFPEAARELRRAMPHSVVLVPGFGAQGGTADTIAANFNEDGLGAVVNASRSITYAGNDPAVSRDAYQADVRNKVNDMTTSIVDALRTCCSGAAP